MDIKEENILLLSELHIRPSWSRGYHLGVSTSEPYNDLLVSRRDEEKGRPCLLQTNNTDAACPVSSFGITKVITMVMMITLPNINSLSLYGSDWDPVPTRSLPTMERHRGVTSFPSVGGEPCDWALGPACSVTQGAQKGSGGKEDRKWVSTVTVTSQRTYRKQPNLSSHYITSVSLKLCNNLYLY